MTGLRDHLLPGLGEMDFARIMARRCPRSAVLTCELDWYYTPQEIVAGRSYVVAQADRNRVSSEKPGF